MRTSPFPRRMSAAHHKVVPMTITIPVADLHPTSPKPHPTLVGRRITDNVHSYVATPIPKTVTYLPLGDSMDVPAGGVVSVLKSISEHNTPSWATYHCAEAARLQGPVLAHVETERAYTAKTGKPITAGRIKRSRLALQALMTAGACIVGMLFILHAQSLDKQAPLTMPSSEEPFGRLAAMQAEKIADLGQGMAGIMTVLSAMTLLMLLLMMFTTLLGRVHSNRTITTTLSRAALQRLEVSDTQQRTQMSTDPLYTRRSTVMGDRLMGKVPGVTPTGDLLYVPEGDTYEVPKNHTVSFWVKEERNGRDTTPAHWAHIHTPSTAFVYGPTTIAVQPASMPSFWQFWRNCSESNGSYRACAGACMAGIGGVVMLLLMVSVVRHPIDSLQNWTNTIQPFLFFGALITAGYGLAKWAYAPQPRSIEIPATTPPQAA